ncbi:MAG TPA: DegQ family serine endoprotease [Verrucomicrobiae bacterium]|jgi:serine protease Do
MKTVSRSLTGFFAGALGTIAILTLVYFNAWAKDIMPAINVDSTPIARNTSGITSFAPIVKKAAPSVVNIYSTHFVHQRLYHNNPFFGDPLFRQFFGGQMPQGGGREITRKEESLGSGVIVSPDGYILTANHVVEGADQIKVSIADDKKEYTAKVIGTDPPTDMAVLKIDATGLSAITLGDSDQLEVGDISLAIGNPFGVGQTVTMGIISALGRNIPDLGEDQRVHIQDFIQTDAAINPGNSGGALVDAEGRLIGINTAIESGSGGNEGVGFAVPVNMARYVMESLLRNGGKIEHGYLGTILKDITPDFAAELNLPNQNGALVDDVFDNSPAQKGGIQAGDVITSFNGKAIDDTHSLQLMVSQCPPGTTASIQLIRKGATQTVTVTLGQLPGSFTANNNGSSSTPATVPDALDGVTVDDLTTDVREQLRVPQRIHGAIVVSVDQESNAAEAGLRENDIILQINQQPVASADDAVKLCSSAKGDHILLQIWRRMGDQAMTTFISVDNAKRQQPQQ